MLNVAKYCLLVLVAITLLQAPPAVAAAGANGHLVTVEWLKQNRNQADVVILDAAPPPMYAAQHIPGAISASLMTYGSREGTVAEMEQRYQSWGISGSRKIVIYDQGDPMWATRLFFDLYYRGFPPQNLFVLDGGLAKWQETGGPVTKDVPAAPPKGDFRITQTHEDLRVRLPEILNATGDTTANALVEALDPDWHFGETVFFSRPGHIPHGIMLPANDFYNADKTFKSPAEIRKMFDYVGVKPEQQIHTYCGGGVAASVPFFALKFILGFPNVKLFQESELGWLKDERGLPYWTYDAPYLMRETGWLKTWGGRMMRMYGGSQLSVIDVRSADEFNFRHVPFAVNIPAQVFKDHAGNPAQLAFALGQAGVSATHEAVVVSGTGLNPDAALAYLMLERLGQKKTSVFIDAIDKSAQLGMAMNEPAKATDARKAPPAKPQPATNYAANLRHDVVIADPASTRGLYPKVFIASGKTLPAQVPAGKVVHVPYTELLNADGTPKAAKDIWTILVKAGVPRYAELVSFAEQPGEAAVNYFVLRLMGYPDVKVLLM